MSKLKLTLAVMFLSLAVGCATEPFKSDPSPPLKDSNPQAVRHGFMNQLTDHRFTLDQTLKLQAPFHKDLSVLSELVVDPAAGQFHMVGLSPLGVTLFQISGDHARVTIDFAVPPLMEHKDLLLELGRDVWRMQFDLIPGAGADVVAEETAIRFREETAEGRLTFEFGGDPTVLREKRVDGFFGTIWRVRYFQYTSPPGMVHPRGVVIDDDRFHFRLVIRNRSIQ